MRASVKMLDDTYGILGDAMDSASPADAKTIASQMARTNAESTSEDLFLSHLEAATTEVAAPTAESYTELNTGLANLQQLKQNTADLQKVLQLAGAIASNAANNRQEVSSRTT